MQGEKFSGLLTFLGYSKVLCAQQNFWSTEKFSYHPNFTVCQKFLDCYDFFECFKKFASPKNFSKQSILRCKMLGVPKNFTFRESLVSVIISTWATVWSILKAITSKNQYHLHLFFVISVKSFSHKCGTLLYCGKQLFKVCFKGKKKVKNV